MEIHYTLSKRFVKDGEPHCILTGSALASEGVTKALIERGWTLNGDRFERDCNAFDFNMTLWHLVKHFDVKLFWDRPRKKKVEKPEPKSEIKLVPVKVEDVKTGMVISGHGKVVSAEPIQGRSLVKKGKRMKHVQDGNGPLGILFKTTDHPEYGCFFANGATVWCVK